MPSITPNVFLYHHADEFPNSSTMRDMESEDFYNLLVLQHRIYHVSDRDLYDMYPESPESAIRSSYSETSFASLYGDRYIVINKKEKAFWWYEGFDSRQDCKWDCHIDTATIITGIDALRLAFKNKICDFLPVRQNLRRFPCLP